MNNTAKQLVEQLGDNTELTIMADVVHGLDYEYEQLQQENEYNKYILTEFEKWLEERESSAKINPVISGTIKGVLDKLQELKGSSNEKGDD